MASLPDIKKGLARSGSLFLQSRAGGVSPQAVVAVSLAALLIRIAWLGGNGFSNDVSSFVEWAALLAVRPLSQFYQSTSFADYPPGYYYVLWLVGRLSVAFFPSDASHLALRWLVKVPAIAADLANCALVYAIVRHLGSRTWAYLAAACVAFDPTLIYVSAYWGQVDSLPAMCTLLSLYLVITLGRVRPGRRALRVAAAWVALGVSILIKPAAIVLVPLYLVHAFATDAVTERRSRLAGTLSGVVGAVSVAYLLALPFHPALNPAAVLGWLFDRYRFGADAYPYTSVNAFNLYATPPHSEFWTPDSTPVYGLAFGIPQNVWGLCLFAIATALTTLRFYQRKDPKALLEAAMILSLAYFMLLTRMHERYVYNAVLLSLPLIVVARSYVVSAILISVTTLVNFNYTRNYIYILDYGIKGLDNNNLAPVLSHTVAWINVALFVIVWSRFLGFVPFETSKRQNRSQ